MALEPKKTLGDVLSYHEMSYLTKLKECTLFPEDEKKDEILKNLTSIIDFELNPKISYLTEIKEKIKKSM